MADVASVTAVTAATAQTAAAPVTIDAMFGAILQSVTEAETAALATPPVQNIAPAMVDPQQSNAAVTPGLETPWLYAPVAAAAPMPEMPTADGQQSAAQQLPQNMVGLPQAATPAPNTTVADNSEPSAPVAPTPVPTFDVPAPQQVTQVAPQAAPQAAQPQTAAPQPAEPLPASPEQTPVAQAPVPPPVQTSAPAQTPVQTPSQTESPQTTSAPVQPVMEAPAAPAATSNVASQAPAPRDSEPVAAPKTKAEPQEAKSDANTNPMVDVLAGFLLAQIEPITPPANDATADTVDPVASTKSDDQKSAAAADQTPTPPAQPAAPAAVPPPVVPVASAAPVAPVAQRPIAPQDNTTAPATPVAAQDNAAPVAQKPAAKQQAKAQQPVFVPANDTQPESKPELQPQPAPEARGPSTAEQPQPAQPAQANATSPAPHQAPVAPQIANPAIAPAAPSGLRQLTAGLRVTAQEQDTTSSIDKLGLTIATKSIDGLRQFDIRLDPPELGRVQVQLTTDDSGRTQANVVVDKPHTLELLQRDAQSLNRALNDAGLDVSNNGLNFSLREQYRQNDGGVDQGRNRSLSVQAVMQTDATPIHSSLGSYAPNSVRLDIRV